jgi:hypothetical protein
LKEAVVVNPTEPVPCNKSEFNAKLAVPDNEPVTIIAPWKFALPVTVIEPVMYGELSIILFRF